MYICMYVCMYVCVYITFFLMKNDGFIFVCRAMMGNVSRFCSKYGLTLLEYSHCLMLSQEGNALKRGYRKDIL